MFKKKKLLFIADKPDWAYEFMIKAWLPFLLNEYNCFIAYQKDYAIKSNTATHSGIRKISYNLLNKLRLKLGLASKVYQISENHNYFYPVYRKNPVYQYDEKLQKHQTDQKDFDMITEMAFYLQYTAEFPFSAAKKIVGIFTDKFPHDGPNMDLKNNTDRNILSREAFYNTYLKKFNHIIVGGGNLLNDYRKLTGKVDFVYGIYGQDNFIENKTVGSKPYLTIGWTGTPDRPMKGFRAIIEPAIENVRRTGRDVRLKTKFSGPYEELYSFYRDVDCVIIASDADSGPSMYAEACLSGVPCISTRIGLPLSFLKNGTNGIFIDRNIESLALALTEIYDDRRKLQALAGAVKQDYLRVMDNKLTVTYFEKILKEI